MVLATGWGQGLHALAGGWAGLCKPVWQKPEPFEAFCGFWLLLPCSLFQPFHSQPRQETSASPPSPHNPQAGLGNRGTL